LKAWVLGVILIFVGLLITAYGFGHSAFDFITPTIGILVMGIGFWILVTKFRQWVHEH
jgi:uncharacterized ion transporter superfamily protein YfcC